MNTENPLQPLLLVSVEIASQPSHQFLHLPQINIILHRRDGGKRRKAESSSFSGLGNSGGVSQFSQLQKLSYLSATLLFYYSTLLPVVVIRSPFSLHPVDNPDHDNYGEMKKKNVRERGRQPSTGTVDSIHEQQILIPILHPGSLRSFARSFFPSQAEASNQLFLETQLTGNRMLARGLWKMMDDCEAA